MRSLFFIGMLVVPVCLWAQESAPDSDQRPENELTVDAQLLTRGELRRGGLSDVTTVQDADKANFVIDRARLSLDYKRDVLSARISFQHEGLWGIEGEGANFNIYEAWGQLTARNGFFARIGRQELRYDDERILGNNDWAMAALSHDALKVGYEGHGHKAHVFGAYNQNAKNMKGGTYYTNGSQPYKTMLGAWYHYDVPRFPLDASLLFLNIGMQGGLPEYYRTVNQQLYGGYLTFHPKNLKMELSYYRQGGKACLNYKSALDLPLRAWMAAVKASYDFNETVTGYAGYDYLSGDEDFVVPNSGNIGLIQHTAIKSFTSVFGSSHKFYGAMDYFYMSAYYGTNSPGLQNLYGGAVVKPVKGLSLDASYHYMAMTTNLSGLNKTLGHIIDISASYDVMRDVNISAGYSFMRGSESMEALKRSTASRQLSWGWLKVVISPRIFSTKWK